MYGFRQPTPQPSQFGQATMQRDLLEPNTGAVIGAFVDEATSGLGTLSADLAANRVKELEKKGTPLTEEQYKASPNFSVPFYRGITEESAAELKQFNDNTHANAELINSASSGQYATALTAGFVAGVFEPKNLVTGLATSFVLTPLAGAVPVAANLRRLMKLRATANNYGGKVALGAIEGGVSAAIAEPSNRYSASILRQDYTMADSAWNIALSTAFGVGASAAGIGAKEVPAFMRSKLERFKADTMNVVAHEVDTAVGQMALGQKVDVAHVESIAVGDLAKKPIAEQAKAVEQFTRYTETPEFKAKFEGSKVVDETGAPLRVFHGTNKEFDNFSADLLGTQTGADSSLLGYFFTEKVSGEHDFITSGAEVWATEPSSGRFKEGANIRPTYLDIKNPKKYSASEMADIHFGNKASVTELRNRLISEGYDGISGNAGDENWHIAFRPDQIISATGADDYQAIVKRLQAENKASINKAAEDSVSPDNDTAIDAKAIAELEAYEETLALRKDEAALDEYNAYLKEVSAMKKQGLLSEADETAKMDAINSVNEKDLDNAYAALQLCLTRG
jgi:hypothetical protein